MPNWFELSDVIKYYSSTSIDALKKFNSDYFDPNSLFFGIESVCSREFLLFEIPDFIKDIYDEGCEGWFICKKNYWSSANLQIKKNIGGIEHSYVFDGYFLKSKNGIIPVKLANIDPFKLNYLQYYYISELCDFGKFIMRNMDKLNPSYRKNYMYGYHPSKMTETLHCSWRK